MILYSKNHNRPGKKLPDMLCTQLQVVQSGEAFLIGLKGRLKIAAKTRLQINISHNEVTCNTFCQRADGLSALRLHAEQH